MITSEFLYQCLVALVLGLSSTVHCLGMCGGISNALMLGQQRNKRFARWLNLLVFQSGRVMSYGLIGLLGGMIFLVPDQDNKQLVMVSRAIANTMIILIGLYIIGISRLLRVIESKMAFIWKALQPIIGPLIKGDKIWHAALLGFCWGFLPCGIVYSTAIWAATEVRGIQASVLMMAFGLGTVPAMFAITVIGQEGMRGFRAASTRKVLGLFLVAYGLWGIISMVYPLLSSGHHMHH